MADTPDLDSLQRVLQMVRAYIDAPGQVRGELYRELVATVQAAEGLTIQAGATWAATCERLQAQLAAANARIVEAERLLRELVHEGDLGWTLTDENQLYVEISKTSIDDARKFLEAK